VQVTKFLSAVQTWKPGDLLVLDLEVGDGNLSSWAIGFLEDLGQRSGLVPWLYSYGPFIRAHLTDPSLARWPLWLAAYQVTPPPCPPPWKTFQLWQWTDKATIPGIAGPCDESVGTLPAPAAVSSPVAAAPAPVYDYEEATTKTMAVHIGPLDGNGNGWTDWQPGLGRDPIIVGVVQQGPSPPDDGYWPQNAKVNLSAQPRGGAVRICVRNGSPGDTVLAWVTVA
jgi:hypothetical protein